MNKLTKGVNAIKIGTTIISIIIGIVTAILSIVGIINNDSNLANGPIRIMFGTYCLVFALILTIIHLVKSPDTFDLKAVALYGPLTGFGVFLLTSYAGGVLNVLVAILLPAIVAGFGLFLIIKSVVNFVKEKGSMAKNVLILVAAIIITVAGAIFLGLANTTLMNVIWLIFGILMTAGAVVALVTACKTKKEPKANTEEKK